jgi:hypothetical protein
MTKHLIVAGVAILLAASPVLAQRGRAGGAGTDANAAAAAKPTPRAADGHPDLTGVWGGAAEPVKALAAGESTRILFPVRTGPDDKRIFDEMDRAAKERQAAEPNKPPYKPELMEKVQLLSDKRQFNDPSFYCKPLGVPRMGPPSQIVQTPGLVVLLYQGRNTFRTIPTDGRPHHRTRTGHGMAIQSDAGKARRSSSTRRSLSRTAGWELMAGSTATKCTSSNVFHARETR